MTDVDVWQSVRGAAPLVVGGGAALACGLIGLLALLILFLARRPGEGRGHGWLGALSGVLTVGGIALLGTGAVLLAPGATSQLARARALVETKHGMDRDALRFMAAEEIRDLLAGPKHREPKDLNHHEFQVFSQNGEDGIIAEIFRRIGATNRYFVEFGSSNGFENNTALLVRPLGWGGLWIDGDPDAVRLARDHFRTEIDAKKLVMTESFITAENIEDLFKQAGVPEEFDFLSIDIDRNDYYVWEKITHYRPRVVCIEYNAFYPPPIDWVIPYDPKAMWDYTTHTAASLQALARLGESKGYALVGCCLSGINAFFIRKDLLGDHFSPPYTAEHHYEPRRPRLYKYETIWKRVP